MKKETINSAIKCAAVFCGVMLIIHRRVIAAAITGSEMPEAPEWHKKCFPCMKQEEK